jgi:membrane-associated phospholipid phosphatase
VRDAGTPLVTRSAAVAALVGGLLALLLGLLYAGERTAGGVDVAAGEAVTAGLSAHPALPRVLVLPTEPAVLVPAIVLLVLLRVRARDPRAAVVAALAPAVAVVVNTWLLKPAFGRYLDDHLAYPSGHTVSLVAVLTVAGLLVRQVKLVLITALGGALLVCLVAIGMIGLRYHYLTDVLGGAGFALCATVLVAAAVDATAGLTGREAATARRPSRAR